MGKSGWHGEPHRHSDAAIRGHRKRAEATIKRLDKRLTKGMSIEGEISIPPSPLSIAKFRIKKKF